MPKKAVVALVGVLVLACMGLGISRFVGGGAPNPYKWIEMSPEKLAKKLNKLYEHEESFDIEYFSSANFRDYCAVSDAMNSLGDVRVSKKYAGEFMVSITKDGTSDPMTKSDLKLGLVPEGVICIEVTKDKVPSAKNYVKELKRRGAQYDHIFAVKLDDASDLLPVASEGKGLCALFYSDDYSGFSGVIENGDVRLRIDAVMKGVDSSIQSMFEVLGDSEETSELFSQLGVEGVSDYVFE